MPAENDLLEKMEQLYELRRSHLNALNYLIDYREDNVNSPQLRKELGRGDGFFDKRFTYIFVKPHTNELKKDPIDVVQAIYGMYGIETRKHITHLDNQEREILYVVQPYDKLTDAQRKFLDESCPYSKREIMNTLSEITLQMDNPPENEFLNSDDQPDFANYELMARGQRHL